MATIPWSNQFLVGSGINTATNKTYRRAIDDASLVSEATGIRAALVLEKITSTRQLTETLNISASASLNLGIGGGSAEFKLSQSREVNSYYTYALVRCEVINPAELFRAPQLTDEARGLLEAQGWDAFEALYGPEYILGRITGGAYYGLIEIQSSSVAEQQDIRAKLGGFYGPIRAEAQLQTTFRELATTYGMNVLVTQSGGNQDVIEVSLDEMIVQAREFAQTVASNPVVISALTTDYRSSVVLPATQAYNSLPRQRQRDTLDDLGKQYLRLRDNKANLEFILGRPSLAEFDEFRDLEAIELEEKRTEYKALLGSTVAEIDEITRRAKKCAEDMTQCETYAVIVDNPPNLSIRGELMNLQQMEESLRTLQVSLNDLRAGIVDGAIVAQKAMMLQARNSDHLIRFSHVDAKNHDVFRMWRDDNTWHDTLSVQHAGIADRIPLIVSPQFEWRSGDGPVRMWHSSDSIAILSYVSGNFAGGGENVSVYVENDGYWYLHGHTMQDFLMAGARCIALHAR